MQYYTVLSIKFIKSSTQSTQRAQKNVRTTYLHFRDEAVVIKKYKLQS